MCMCMCVRACVCACVHVCDCVCVHACMCVCMCMFVCMHVCVCMCVHVCVCVCMCMCVCMRACVCMCVCMHVWESNVQTLVSLYSVLLESSQRNPTWLCDIGPNPSLYIYKSSFYQILD